MLIVGIISVIIYIIAVIMVYTNTYELKKDGKLKFTIIGIIAILIITWIIVLISSNGIQVEEEKFKKRVLIFAIILLIIIIIEINYIKNFEIGLISSTIK
jgi:hypothetical protein